MVPRIPWFGSREPTRKPRDLIDDMIDEELGDQKKRRKTIHVHWWYCAGCFAYSIVGAEIFFNLERLGCFCQLYPWYVESTLLFLQGFLSFLHDAYFIWTSRPVKYMDRALAVFLCVCQPVKFAFCAMDTVQLVLLLAFFILGLVCFSFGKYQYSIGRLDCFQCFHTLWHLFLPFGGHFWIRYTINQVVHNDIIQRYCMEGEVLGPT